MPTHTIVSLTLNFTVWQMFSINFSSPPSCHHHHQATLDHGKPFARACRGRLTAKDTSGTPMSNYRFPLRPSTASSARATHSLMRRSPLPPPDSRLSCSHSIKVSLTAAVASKFHTTLFVALQELKERGSRRDFDAPLVSVSAT